MSDRRRDYRSVPGCRAVERRRHSRAVFVPSVLDQLKVVGFQIGKIAETSIEYVVQVIDLVGLIHEPRCEQAVNDQSPPGAGPLSEDLGWTAVEKLRVVWTRPRRSKNIGAQSNGRDDDSCN